MSYAAIGPSVYETYQPETPWHAGGEGWWGAPIPGWGQNPNLLDRRRYAVQGLGCGGGCGCSNKGMGAYYAAKALQPIPMGSYYDGRANLPVSGLDVEVMPEGGKCPPGYEPGNLASGGVALETPICVKRSYTALHVGVGALAGFLVAKLMF